ncbi:hypothetical protein [Burkholderia multivorans]|nr:hypothetical protein [Burkholderia multivorans]MDR8920535.1 hypothetical protein [Burkholderia multivorans]MDR8921940.1 hypothetical protein [Burkholderia multivorans]MDR8967825.1 hypothetical protein [Burkholderia multivorans]MDR8993498.1 hypothetical protein [Burkholderia multivorans]MDR9019597.1 hypothetical protein [Burkholderia multivorans]
MSEFKSLEDRLDNWGAKVRLPRLLGVQKAALDVYEMRRCKKYDDRKNMTPDQSQQIEELLMTWYRWQIRQSHAEILSHYYRPEDRTCRGYVTPTTDEEDDENAYQWADDRQSEQVQLCIDNLAADQRAAISVSMRNKECGRDVWSSIRARAAHATYQAAKAALLPMLISKQLIKVGEAA